MCIEKSKFKIICKITHQVFIGQRSKTQIDMLSYSPAHGEFKNFCFVFVVSTVWVSRTFVYDVVNVNKIVIVSSTKPPSYAYAQVTVRLKIYLG